MPDSNKIYFLSDAHLGAPDYTSSLQRERKLVRFLESIRHDAAEIFIVGDLFDFWFEYRRVVPRGYVRVLGKIAELADAGIKMHFFTGNHDMWMRDYFQTELNTMVYFEPAEFVFSGKRFFIAHGDGLGPGDHGYKRLKKVFRNTLAQKLFAAVPPGWGMGLANYLSRNSRRMTGTRDETFLGEDKEWLVLYAKDLLQKKRIGYFVFGHRHLPLDINLGSARYLNLGDWIKYFSYAVFDGQDIALRYFEE